MHSTDYIQDHDKISLKTYNWNNCNIFIIQDNQEYTKMYAGSFTKFQWRFLFVRSLLPGRWLAMIALARLTANWNVRE